MLPARHITVQYQPDDRWLADKAPNADRCIVQALQQHTRRQKQPLPLDTEPTPVRLQATALPQQFVSLPHEHHHHYPSVPASTKNLLPHNSTIPTRTLRRPVAEEALTPTPAQGYLTPDIDLGVQELLPPPAVHRCHYPLMLPAKFLFDLTASLPLQLNHLK
ncbi:MAG: hypothetical protein BA874_04820 [Desulfuromonadales bacterium C00003068]|nr:MAG: hypothetical protein BA874_04820 [Desulfuromonadales bacterium C00003068]